MPQDQKGLSFFGGKLILTLVNKIISQQFHNSLLTQKDENYYSRYVILNQHK